jgi:hypothetical protein
MTSAGTAVSRASRRPSSVRTSLTLWPKRFHRAHPVGANHDHLAGLDIAHVGGVDEIEGARLRAHDPGVTQPAERQRAEPVRVADRDQVVARDQRERERAGELRDRLDERVLEGPGLRARIEVEHHLGIAVALKDRAGAHQPFTNLVRVHDVAVVADADLPVNAVDQNWLRVTELALASRRVPRVPDRKLARELGQRRLVEDVGDVPHLADGADAQPVRGRDTGALLPAMLQ